MADTPYAPPTAHVSDPVVSAGPRPRSVRFAALCLWASAAFGLVTSAVLIWPMVALTRAGGSSLIALILSVVIVALTVGLLALFAVKVNAGRNWARWFFLALYAFGTVLWVLSLFASPETYRGKGLLGDVVDLLQVIIQTAAAVLLFVRPSREWFAAMK